MRDNKKKDEPKKTSEQEALERHVDAMMDPRLPDPSDKPGKTPPEKPEPAPAIERLNVRTPKSAKAAKTAPELPSAAKKITVSDASAKPLSIDKLDQLAESIVAEDKPGPPDDKPGGESVPQDDGTDGADDAAPDKSGAEVPDEAGASEPGTDLDDSRTDEAVDDIVAHEGDVILAVADATIAERNREAERMTGKKSHKGLSTVFWFLVAVMAVLAIAITVLVATGGNPDIPKL